MRKVELVRLPNLEAEPEEAGAQASRPATAVFPTESKKLKRVDEATIQAALGNKRTKFLSESELDSNKAVHGERLEDGTYSGRTLTEAIIANRDEKEAKFKEQWKMMKAGKNRPLDDDDMAFVNHLEEEESRKRRDLEKAEREGLASFKEMQAQYAATESADTDRNRPVLRRPVRKATVVAVQRKTGTASAGEDASPSAAATIAEPASTPAEAASKPEGVAGFLGGYGSDSSSGEESE